LIGNFQVGACVGIRFVGALEGTAADVGALVFLYVGAVDGTNAEVGEAVFLVGALEGTAAVGAFVFLDVGALVGAFEGTAAAVGAIVGALVFLIRVSKQDFRSLDTSNPRLFFEKANLIKNLIELSLNPLGNFPILISSQIKDSELCENFEPPEKYDPVIGDTARISEALVNFR
jgi:hypothetical protein